MTPIIVSSAGKIRINPMIRPVQGAPVQQSSTDVLSQAMIDRFRLTIDSDETGARAPQGIHWCLGLLHGPTAELGHDGYPRHDPFAPPTALPHRLWASSSIEFLQPIYCGAMIQRVSRLGEVTEKQGGSGKLAFVVIEHEIVTDGLSVVREKQCNVWRERGGAPVAPTIVARHDPVLTWPWQQTIAPDEAMLFRYAALTFNTNRVHFDHPFATRVAGFRGLVVQGPLIAILMLDLARRHLGESTRLSRFSFRGQSPAIVGDRLRLFAMRNDSEVSFAALDDEDRLIMTAQGAVSD